MRRHPEVGKSKNTKVGAHGIKVPLPARERTLPTYPQERERRVLIKVCVFCMYPPARMAGSDSLTLGEMTNRLFSLVTDTLGSRLLSDDTYKALHQSRHVRDHDRSTMNLCP